MTIITKLLTAVKRLNTCLFRKYSNVVKRELEVLPFCDVYINVPYSLNIKPLNVHKYHNCDTLIIQNDAQCGKSLECSVDGNHVTIVDNTEDTNIIAQIKIPVKANLYVTSKKDITVGQLNGDKINLKSVEGDISVDKFHGESIKVVTKNGNINLKDAIHASKIEVVVTENGSIHAGKLQGLDLRLRTNKGDITVESSYCNESVFETHHGNLSLSNLHKHCKILVKEGHLNLAGLDGRLSTTIEEGSADIHLSRIMGNSEINIKNGSLHLKLAELCQEYIKFLLRSDSCDVAKVFKCEHKEPGCVIINPEFSEEHLVIVNCLNGSVVVESASWQDMIRMKLKK